MKKRSKILLGAVLSIITLGSIGAYAGSGEKCGFGMMGGFSSEKRAGFMVKRLTGKLDLSEAQVEKLKAIQQQFSERRKAMKESRNGELLALLDAPELNQQQALSLIENRSTQRQQQAPEMIAVVADFTNSLNDE
ncbi:MAG: periplasmic heavy metal sensor [Thiotrichaceae bacterium]